MVLLLSTSVTSAYRLPPPLVNRGCALHPVKLCLIRTCGGLRWDSGDRHQWADHLERVRTSGAVVVAGRLHMCTEDAAALDCQAPLRSFYAILVLKINALTDLLTVNTFGTEQTCIGR